MGHTSSGPSGNPPKSCEGSSSLLRTPQKAPTMASPIRPMARGKAGIHLTWYWLLEANHQITVWYRMMWFNHQSLCFCLWGFFVPPPPPQPAKMVPPPPPPRQNWSMSVRISLALFQSRSPASQGASRAFGQQPDRLLQLSGA